MNKTMDYETLRDIYIALGSDKFFDLFNTIYSEYEIFSMSTDWVESNEYILKFKGAKGDIIIEWN